MFDAILRIYIDVISMLTLQPRPRAADRDCQKRI